MIRLILGRKEKGKTTLAYHMARKVRALVIFDPRGMMRRPGAFVARTQDSLSRGMDALNDGEIRELVYTPSDHLPVAFAHFAAEVKRWIDETPDRPLAVLVDEISFVNLGEPDFAWALKCCRASVIHFFLTCHRPADVPVDVRAIADYWYLFQAHQEHDLDVLAERCSPAVAGRVAKLTGSEFVAWNNADGDGELRTYTDRTAWYVDLAPGRPESPAIEMDDL